MEYHDQDFRNQEVLMDGNTFIGCFFEDCTIIFRGADKFTLGVSRFRQCHVKFVEPAARGTELLREMYHGGFRDYVEGLFEEIRRIPPKSQ